MNVGNPSREPALERAMPGDAVPGSTIPEDSEAEVLLLDGRWVWCQVIGQRKDRHGRWCVGIRWYASPSIGGREGWFLLDQRYIRRPDGLNGWRTAGEHGRAGWTVETVDLWLTGRHRGDRRLSTDPLGDGPQLLVCRFRRVVAYARAETT